MSTCAAKMGDSMSPSSVRKLSMKRSPSSLSSYSLRSKGNGRVLGLHQGCDIHSYLGDNLLSNLVVRSRVL